MYPNVTPLARGADKELTRCGSGIATNMGFLVIGFAFPVCVFHT